ncbi:MAG: L,D-transpeptidase family protein [Chitinophagales bacterium]|nr:L,D-transpeptidase family protein [Chitinophagales bacterium]
MELTTTTIKKHKSFTTIHTPNNKRGEKKFYKSFIYGGKRMWITLSLTFFLVLSEMKAQESFLAQQLNYPRVLDAFKQKDASLEEEFLSKSLSWPPKEIYIRAFKSEQELELWVREGSEFSLFKTYDICKNSGTLGPKEKQGDKQVPEGFYRLDRFNPQSNFWLSLGIDYPNKVDLERTTAADPGGDIFIHGNCVTIGCLPMTDEKIKEIYLLAVLARNAGQDDIFVHIFPYKFTLLNNAIFSNIYPKHASFWKDLEAIYLYFEDKKQIPNIQVNKNRYILP